jgi:hypothetical protein
MVEFGSRARKLPAPPALLTPGQAPDVSKTGHLRKWLNQLLFADLRYSYGQ